MKSEEIQSVIALMERHDIAAFEYECGSVRLQLKLGETLAREAAVVAPQAVGPEVPDLLRSPAVGFVLHAHPASGTPAPTLPRRAAKGEIVAYIKTGVTLRAVAVPDDCVLHRALVAEGHGVGYDAALFEIER